MTQTKGPAAAIGYLLIAFMVGFVLLAGAGWVQHVYTCFTTNRWGFLIAGALFVPVAVVHGWGIWLGLW